ncbi:hypothetical protein PG996_010092 [Apiospora saccharicola]|uniref:BZIP domain-containing protein n=1 Tax=Apiospora saccharicola TaxID=335842 RepID=A0ABR1UMN2_9PEZI
MSSANGSNAWMGYFHSATPEPSGTGGNGAQNDQMPQNAFMPVNHHQPQPQPQPQAPQRAEQQAQSAPVRRRGPGIIGRGMLPLSNDLPVQEYERRRQHNSEQAEENKKVQRERNNEAARRSRQRRADLIEEQKSEIAQLKEETGALTRERDYWKGIVDRMQGVGGSRGQQQAVSSQYLAYPAAMAPSVPVNSTPLNNIAVVPAPAPAPAPATQASAQLMRPFPDMGSASAQAQAQAQGAALAAASANPNLADFNLLPLSDAPDNGLGNSEFFQQMEEFEASMKKGDSMDALENFNFSI